jgi:hypothetical protein
LAGKAAENLNGKLTISDSQSWGSAICKSNKTGRRESIINSAPVDGVDGVDGF